MSTTDGSTKRRLERSPVGLMYSTDLEVTEVEYLDPEDALFLVRKLGVGPVRDLGLLYSAMARPRSSAFGVDAYPTIAIKAAALLHSLAGNHPLIDGNKGLAWLATVVFLDLNGLEPKVSDNEAVDVVWEVASGESDLTFISTRLRIEPR
jgi:death-on-curing protein